jgi:hypothetical protein
VVPAATSLSLESITRVEMLTGDQVLLAAEL